MCKVYNQVGSLTEIKAHLQRYAINDFHSVNELITFQRSYETIKQELISSSSIQIQKEKEDLKVEIDRLAGLIESAKVERSAALFSELEQLKAQLAKLDTAPSGFFEKLTTYFSRTNIEGKIRRIENNFDMKIADTLRQYSVPHGRSKNRLEYIELNPERATQELAATELQELSRKKKVIDALTPVMYGAIGEQKVSAELGHLSDDFILINDFSVSFNPLMFNSKEKDYIKSVQIDHILVSPSGVFLIETKNWSEQSLNNLSLRSPVDQIKRTNFALYRMLNGERVGAFLQHHWGDRKVPIKNLIVLINQKPNEEFQYVKVLTLNELRKYIEYFKPCFSPLETKMIANYLLNINDGKIYKA